MWRHSTLCLNVSSLFHAFYSCRTFVEKNISSSSGQMRSVNNILFIYPTSNLNKRIVLVTVVISPFFMTCCVTFHIYLLIFPLLLSVLCCVVILCWKLPYWRTGLRINFISNKAVLHNGIENTFLMFPERNLYRLTTKTQCFQIKIWHFLCKPLEIFFMQLTRL